MMPDATRYTYEVSWSEEDQEHVATCSEFPLLSWLASDPVAALAGMIRLVREVVEDEGFTASR